MKNLFLAVALVCASMSSFAQTFSGSGSMDVEAELLIPLTVTGSLLDFNKVAIPAVGVRYYVVKGDGSMLSNTTSGTESSASGDQNDFEGSPTVSTVTINGTPDVSVQINSNNAITMTNDDDGSQTLAYPRFFEFGTTNYIATNASGGATVVLNSAGELQLSMGGLFKVFGLDQYSPNTPGIYRGVAVLTAQY